MKTKFYWVALVASAALIAQAQAGDHHGSGGGVATTAHPAPAHAAGPAFHSAPRGSFGGGRFMARGPRFSSYHAPMAFRQQRFGDSDRAFARNRQFATGTTNRRFDGSRTFNRRGTRNGNDSRNRLENRGSGREHLFARHSADWHRDWDRRHDHWWHGHRCHFVNGYWLLYDTGFYPYNYWYSYDYYSYDSYPYEYDANVYEGDGTDYDGQGAYDSSEQYADSPVAAAQEQLARQGYYRGEIDGVFGSETRRAIMRFQSGQGLRVTGSLNTDTLYGLGLSKVAND
jgi:hypothetical protein